MCLYSSALCNEFDGIETGSLTSVLLVIVMVKPIAMKYRLYTEVEVSMGFINRATQSRG